MQKRRIFGKKCGFSEQLKKRHEAAEGIWNQGYSRCDAPEMEQGGFGADFADQLRGIFNERIGLLSANQVLRTWQPQNIVLAADVHVRSQIQCSGSGAALRMRELDRNR